VLRGHTAWSSGAWRFSDGEALPWNGLGNKNQQIMALAEHLVSAVRKHPLHRFRLEHPGGRRGTNMEHVTVHPEPAVSLGSELDSQSAHGEVAAKI